MPERQSTGEDIPARLVARRRGGRRGRARHQLLRGDGDDDPRVAGRRRRRAGHPPDAGPGGGARDPHPGAPRQGVPGDRPADRARAAVRLGRPAGETLLVEAAGAVRGDRRARRGGHLGPVRRPGHRPDAAPRGFRDLGRVPVGADRRPARRGAPRGAGRDGRPGRRTARASARLPARRRADGGRLRRRRGRRPGPRQGPAPGRGVASAAAAAGRDRARGAGRGLGRPGGGRPVADPERHVLPDPHRADPAGDRAEELAAADPRDGRPRARAHLRGPDGASVHARPGSPSTACPTRSAVS